MNDPPWMQQVGSTRDQGPLIVTFVTDSFLVLFDNWHRHLRALGRTRILAVAMDEAAAEALAARGVAVLRHGYDGSLGDFWARRLPLFAALAEAGQDFIHSDLDAVWLADPVPACFDAIDAELIFSQGTYHPEAAFRHQGFVLCCGWFAVRGTAATAAFFRAAAARAALERDDQTAINLLLIESGILWRTDEQTASAQPFAGRAFACFAQPLRGDSAALDLRVALLPQEWVPRLPSRTPAALVVHPISPHAPAEKLPILVALGAWRGSSPPQRLIFTYHKSGTTLFDRLARRLAAAFNLTLSIRYGYVAEIPPEPDIVLLAHSLIGRLPARPFRGIRVIRDPRDLWVSAYLYHLRTDESWCTNTDLDPTPPITYPRVDFSIQHLPEAQKRAYLAHLDGRSYRQNLQDRDRASGLAFERDGYTAATLAAMRAWRFSGPDLRDVRLESLAANYDGTMRAVLAHLGFAGPALDQALALAAAEDIARMDDAEIAARPQIGSRTLSKWRAVLTREQIAAFEAAHGDLIDRLGYPRGE